MSEHAIGWTWIGVNGQPITGDDGCYDLHMDSPPDVNKKVSQQAIEATDLIDDAIDAARISGDSSNLYGRILIIVDSAIRAALASERAKREGDWSICMIYPAPGDPFRRIECQIIDRGYADRIMTIACPSELAYESPAPDAATLREGLENAIQLVCQLCRRLNPQHKNCNSCEEVDQLRALLRSEPRGEEAKHE